MKSNLFSTSRLMRCCMTQGEQTLRRALGPVSLVTLGIGAIVGAGIFVFTGTVAANCRRAGNCSLLPSGSGRLRVCRIAFNATRARVRLLHPGRRSGVRNKPARSLNLSLIGHSMGGAELVRYLIDEF